MYYSRVYGKHIRDLSTSSKKRNKTKGLKYLLHTDLPMNANAVDSIVIEEIFEEFSVAQANPEEQVAAYEVNRQKKKIEHHNSQPTQQDIEKAIAEGFYLDPDWKTYFTIKAF